MPDSKISALPSATVPLAGTEVLPIVQSSTTDKVTAADLLRQNGQTVTTSNPVLSLAQTWNAGGVTFTGMLFNATNTASAAASKLLDLQTGGVSQFAIRAGDGRIETALSAFNFWVGATRVLNLQANILGLFSDAATISMGAAGDAVLARDAANTLAQRNGTNAQNFRVYNTYTDASNYERFAINAQSGADVRLQTEKAGTGTVRSIVFGTNASGRWYIDGASGHFLAATDNTYDIGASGATRPRNLYLGGFISAGGSIITSAGSALGYSGRSQVTSPSDGVLKISNNTDTDFSRLQFGGTTNSFPALKRSANSLDVRFADDSGDATLNAGALRSAGSVFAGYGTAIPAGGSNGIGFKGTSATNFGVFFGSGAPTLSAAKGSLYLRSDGSGTGDRMYVNTDSSTTWTAVTTAA